MINLPPYTQFFSKVQTDPRITAQHISLYGALIYAWLGQDCLNPFQVLSQDIMQYAKISGRGTFYKVIRDLDKWEYIRYMPSYNHFSGNLIYILQIEPFAEEGSKPTKY